MCDQIFTMGHFTLGVMGIFVTALATEGDVPCIVESHRTDDDKDWATRK